MKFNRVLTVILAWILMLTGTASAKAMTETFNDYALMFSRSAGQLWQNNQAVSQWAWSPQSSTESHIYWGNPATWSPSYHERFLLNNDWVMLDGWYDNNTYYKMTVTEEWISANDCVTGKQYLPSVNGAQHYTKWNISTTPYCLFARGYLTEQSTGNVVQFQHQQRWGYNPNASNAWNVAVPGLTQQESWWDDNGSPFSLRLTRTQTIARGIGEAWTIRQTYPYTWNADLRYYWKW